MKFRALKFATAVMLGGFLSVTALAEGDGKTTQPGDEQTWSGFLGDDAVYERMEKVVYKDKSKGRRWIASDLTIGKYHAVVIDPVVMYPEVKPSEQVSEEVLVSIQDYLTDGLREKIGDVIALSEAAGEGILRMDVAISGVSVKTEGMKAYEVLPVAAIWGGLKAATGNRAMNVRVYAEMKVSDSVTGDVLATSLRVLEGKDLKGKSDTLELKDVKKALDEAISKTSVNFDSVLTTGESADGEVEASKKKK